MKSDVLKEQIALMKDEKIKEFTIKTLENSPDYFYTAAASSTGKYHPECTIKEGGLIVHVKRAVYFAERLCSGWGIELKEKDIVISATILHDIAKTGKGTGTYEDFENHPLNAAKYFSLSEGVVMDEVVFINRCIENHMGLWTPAKIKKPIKDYTLSELLVYTADYMAASKFVTTPEDK